MGKNDPILAQIEKILQEFKGESGFKITKETRLDGLGLDSLDTVSVIMEIEEKLEASIEMNKETTVTIGDVVKLIEAQRAAK